MSFRQSLIVALLLLTCGAGAARAADITLSPEHRVLLLRNDELVEGQVLLAGDRYDVTVAGGQIHIKRSDVDFVGNTVFECYVRRRSKIEVTKVQENLELAEWCMRHHLYEQAAMSLADAVDADPQHPKIPLLERRLKMAIQQPAVIAKDAQAVDGPTINDLDRTVESLPAGSVETFTTSIQSILLNHCSTSGCHGQASPSLKLMKVTMGRTPSRRSTQRNLYSVLSQVDREHPGQSPLLIVPTGPHGTIKAPIFTNRETQQYKQLVAWVYAASNQNPPDGVGTAGSAVARKVARRPSRTKSTTTAPEGAATRPAVVKHAAVESADDSAGNVIPTGMADADPFDPEVFNRRFQKSESAD